MEKHPLQRRNVVVALENGLHVRPMSLIAQATGGFPGDVSIRRNDGYSVNAKSIFDLLTLRAEKGMELTIEAQGEGATELLDQLEALFEANFGWDEEQDFSEESDPPTSRVQDSHPQPVEPD
ncbi:MAG: HPr family phosphocarrier protein [Planctomycetaceae bacterium]|nr:HPr family phosphocarrier protein [Planctomycetaceae bacterium]